MWSDDLGEVPLLRPELIKTERTLKGYSKERLVEHALTLQAALRDEATYGAQRALDGTRARAQLLDTKNGSQRVIDGLERKVRRLKVQVDALGDYIVRLTAPNPMRESVAPGANVMHEKGLGDER